MTSNNHPLKTILFFLLLPFLLFGLKKIVDTRKKAAVFYANIIVDAQKIDRLLPQNLWQNLAQGGEEPVDMLAPVVTQIKAITPQYIRIDHLFDFYQVYQGPDNFDFSRLDPVVSSIIETGARPFFSLSYTPGNMVKDQKNAGEPEDWNQWYQMVKTTARRYSVEKNIADIYYEVWNEPDLFGSWHYRKSPSYLTLYSQTSKAVVDGAASASYSLGGPSTTAFYGNWLTALLNHCQNQNLKLDFISYHQYSSNPADFQKPLSQIQDILKNYPQYQNLKVIITESGPYSDPNSAYDNDFSAIHLLSLITSLKNNYLDRLFTFEIVDGPSPRSQDSTGWGLLTHTGNSKPRYSAFQFLNQIKGNQLSSSGDGSHVSSLSAGNSLGLQTLLVNYDLNNSHYEKVPLSYQNLTPGNYQIKFSYFNGPAISKDIRLFYTHHTEFITLTPNSAVLVEISPILP